jgi:hypothetical protein
MERYQKHHTRLDFVKGGVDMGNSTVMTDNQTFLKTKTAMYVVERSEFDVPAISLRIPRCVRLSILFTSTPAFQGRNVNP